jgi:hypothetical protein
MDHVTLLTMQACMQSCVEKGMYLAERFEHLMRNLNLLIVVPNCEPTRNTSFSHFLLIAVNPNSCL